MNGIKYILAVYYVYFEDVKRLERRIQDDYFDVIKSFNLLLFIRSHRVCNIKKVPFP